MATWGFQSTAVGHPTQSSNRVYVMSKVVDYAGFSAAAADVVQALVIPDNSAVLLAGMEVLTADSAGNSGTVALGTFSGIASGGFVLAAAPTTVGQMIPVTVPAGGFVSEGTGGSDSIDITGATGVINAKIRVWAVVADLTGLPSTMPVDPVSGTTVA